MILKLSFKYTYNVMQEDFFVSRDDFLNTESCQLWMDFFSDTFSTAVN